MTDSIQQQLDTEKEKNKLLLDIVNAIPEPIIAKNWEGNFIFANQAVAKLYNTTPEQMIGLEDSHFTGNQEQADFFRENVQQIMRNFETQVVYEQSTDVKTGEVKNFQSLKIPFKDAQEQLNIVIIAKDVTELTRLKDEAQRTSKRLEYILAVSQEGIWEWHTDTNNVCHNKDWERITGIHTSEESFQEFQKCIHSEDKKRVNQALDALLTQQQPYSIEFRMIRPDGELIWIWDRGQVMERDDGEQPLLVVGIMQDITQAKRNQETIEYMAYYDALTQLPNRALLQDRLTQSIAHSQRSLQFGAVMFIDLDNFKQLNDLYGHQTGDEVVYITGMRIAHTIRDEDTVARFGGDEFVVILNELGHDPIDAAMKAEEIAKTIRQKINVPMQLNGITDFNNKHSNITASIGIALMDTHGAQSEQLLRLADLALYRAKENGRDDIAFFNPDMQREFNQTLRLERGLQNALMENELELFYQPQFNANQSMVSAEALIRWNHPTEGLISPMRFIPIAEKSNLIIQLGDWVVHQACLQLKQWQDHPQLKDMTLSVNVSAKQVWQSDFVEKITQALSYHQVPAEKLTVEITESVLLSDLQETVQKLAELRTLGCRISLDDFGTGYSSLSYLKSLPLDEIKIDRSFIQDIDQNQSDYTMVKTIIDLGKNFHAQIVSEGVETRAQFNSLKTCGCSIYQGYLFAKPLRANSLEQLDAHASH